MTHDEQMQLLAERHEAELLRAENKYLREHLAQTQACASILERGIEGTRANLASAHDINRTLQQYIGELERQVEQARLFGTQGVPEGNEEE